MCECRRWGAMGCSVWVQRRLGKTDLGAEAASRAVTSLISLLDDDRQVKRLRDDDPVPSGAAHPIGALDGGPWWLVGGGLRARCHVK